MTTQAIAHPRRWAILGVLILALFGVSLDNTILTIALPTLARDLQATASQLQWMVDAYILVFAGLLLVAGAVSDRYGRRRALVAGLTLFGLGSSFAPFVSSADQLIVLRAFMGLGAALTMPSTLSIIGDVFAADERPKAIAAWSSVSALGIVVGPIAGGWLLEHFPWASVFVVNVPFVLVGIVATLLVVPESRSNSTVRLDPVGAALSVGGLMTLVYGIIEVPAKGWSDPLVVASLVAAGLFIAGFLAWERRSDHPMLDIRLFRDRRFSGASLSIALVFFSLMGALFFLTQYLQQVLGYGALETGLRFIPIAAGVLVGAPISAKLTVRYGPRLVTALGLAVIAGGLGLLAGLGTTSGDLSVGSVLFVVAAGIGLAGTPATEAIMSALPKDQFGVGSAVNDTVREVGGALGVAVLGSLFSAAYATRMASVTADLPAAAAAAARDSFAGAAAVAAQVGGPAGAALVVAAKDAFVGAMSWTSLIGIGFAVAGVVVALVLMPARTPAPSGEVADSTGPVGFGTTDGLGEATA